MYSMTCLTTALRYWESWLGGVFPPPRRRVCPPDSSYSPNGGDICIRGLGSLDESFSHKEMKPLTTKFKQLYTVVVQNLGKKRALLPNYFSFNRKILHNAPVQGYMDNALFRRQFAQAASETVSCTRCCLTEQLSVILAVNLLVCSCHSSSQWWVANAMFFAVPT